MKITVKIGDLVEHITQAAITIDRKFPDTPAGKVYLRAKKQVSKTELDKDQYFLYLFSTNQSSKTFIKIEIENIEEEGQTLIDPGKLLGGLIGRDIDQTATIETIEDTGKTRISIGKNVINLPLNNTVDNVLTVIKSLPSGAATAKIEAKTMINFIKRSSFCIPLGSNGQQKFAMGVLNIKGSNGYYISQATDGNIIAYNKATQTDNTEFDLASLLIPVEALNPLQKLLQRHKDLDIEILEGPKDPGGNLQEIFFRMEGVLFGTVLRTGMYPNIETLLTNHEPTFSVDLVREELKASLVRATNFVETETDKRLVNISFTSETELVIKAANSMYDLSDELEISVTEGTFKSVSPLVNIDYLANIASVQSGEKITMGFNSDKTKAIIMNDSSDDKFISKYAIMPVIAGKAEKKPKAKKTKAVEEDNE